MEKKGEQYAKQSNKGIKSKILLRRDEPLKIIEKIDNAYKKKETTVLEGPMTRWRLRKLQEEVYKESELLKGQGGSNSGHTFNELAHEVSFKGVQWVELQIFGKDLNLNGLRYLASAKGFSFFLKRDEMLLNFRVMNIDGGRFVKGKATQRGTRSFEIWLGGRGVGYGGVNVAKYGKDGGGTDGIGEGGTVKKVAPSSSSSSTTRDDSSLIEQRADLGDDMEEGKNPRKNFNSPIMLISNSFYISSENSPQKVVLIASARRNFRELKSFNMFNLVNLERTKKFFQRKFHEIFGHSES
ncbi:hypothetical protein CR513_16566, partial [Mucuna pruriens]